MRINSSSHPTSITQLNRANAELTNFLQSRAESAAGGLLQRVNSRSVSSGRDALSISSLTTLPVSQRGLLASLAVPVDSIGESRTGLSEIRTQLNTILRTAVDSRGKRTTAERLLGQQTVDHAIAEINRLVGDGRSASGRAVLTLQGTADGALEQAGALRIVGGAGEAVLAVTQGESLTGFAERVNARAAQTGVNAIVNGNSIVFQSAEMGPEAGISVQSIAGGVTITGVNPEQLTDFVVNSIASNASETLSGTVSAVHVAELMYDGGAAPLMFDTGTLAISGDLGSGSSTFSRGDSLAELASLVNGHAFSTGVTAKVSGGQLVFQSVQGGSDAQISIGLDYNRLEVSGVNPAQVSLFDVQSLLPGSNNTISADITRRSEQAVQAYVGQNGQVTDTATFDLTGSLGTGTVAMQRGELLTDVADRINLLSSSTGVTASVDGDELQLQSVDYGSDAIVSLEVTKLLQIAGTNSAQIVDVRVDAFPPQASYLIAGEVREVALTAQLKYSGGAGAIVKDNAVFTLEGETGSIAVAVSKSESLFDVADRINAETGNTGVTATVSGNDLLLKSTEFGSTSQVYVEVNAGTFDVSGGDSSGDGEIDFGEDAEIRFNGVDYTGAGNQVSFTDATGSYQVEVVAEYDGDFDPITVASIDNAFQLNGGDGNGHAVGVDAQGVINGQAVTANVNTFLFNDALGSYQLDVQNGYLGLIDSINVASIETSYAIDGGDGNGTANGHDAQLVVNGQTLSGEDNRYWFESNTGSYVLEFAPDFTGSFDVIEVSSQPTGVFSVLGGDGDGRAQGSDLLLRQARTVRFSVVDRLNQVGFFTIGLDAASLGGTRGTLQQLATGGGKAGLGAHATDAITISQQALAYISNVESLLDQAAARDTPSILSLQSVSSTRSANLSLLAIRNALQSGDNRVVESIQHDPQRVLRLLTSKTW